MATLDRKVPSPNTFLYKPWSAYAAEAVKIQNSDIAHVEDTGKDLGTASEARKLNREDMHLYGQYPAYDEFCLVVCNICSQVVKPQGILSHYERRHAPFSDVRAPLSQKSKVPFSSSYRPPRDGEHPPFTRPPHSVYPPKGVRAKPCVSVPVVSLEKMSCLSRTEGPHVRLSYPPSSSSTSPSSSSPAASSARPPPHKPQDRVLNGRVPPSAPPHTLTDAPAPAPSPSPTNPDRRPVPSPSCSLDRQPPAPPPPPPPPPPLPLDRKQQNGTKSTKPYKRVSGRVFDPNKHCGVLDPESKKPCTRSLTCKTHSLTHRRAVPGRGKHFDSLLAEHKGRHLREQQASHAHPARPAQSHEPASSPSTEFQEARPTSLLKSKLANSHIPRPLGGCSSSASQSSSVGPPPDTPSPVPERRRGTGCPVRRERARLLRIWTVPIPLTTRGLWGYVRSAVG
ncbi:hypothetical protein GJAV_G00269390 [Gymnothorax javanicus]|nr:hypothetical protein GJAV_G00269390 [Gymnothorax javanicus]